ETTIRAKHRDAAAEHVRLGRDAQVRMAGQEPPQKGVARAGRTDDEEGPEALIAVKRMAAEAEQAVQLRTPVVGGETDRLGRGHGYPTAHFSNAREAATWHIVMMYSRAASCRGPVKSSPVSSLAT